MPRAPVDKVIVTPHGAFGYPAGPPGPRDHVHMGVDLAGPEGTPVYAPEDGVVYVAAERDDLHPFSGFGPAFVYMQGYSGWWHLLGHLKVGSIKTAGALDTTGTPQVLIALGNKYDVAAGQQLGVTSNRNHVHWEVQQDSSLDTGSPYEPHGFLAKYEATYKLRAARKVDPLAWLKAITSSSSTDDAPVLEAHIPAASTPATSTPAAGGDDLLLWLVGGYFVGRELRWW